MILTMTVLASILAVILISLLVLGGEQCDPTFPDGTPCGEADYFSTPDPLSCWKYYECDSGCVQHKECEGDYKYDTVYEWCTRPGDVDCGDRPCNDDLHCGDSTTTTTTATTNFPECKDGILVVGGKTSAGPSTEISLLSGNQGWCSQSGFPDLPHPLVNPGAYYLHGYLFVCGFPGDFPCMYTSRGWDGWSAVSSLPNQTDYKMTYSSLVGSVMMISKNADSQTYRLQHNPAHANNDGFLTQWMEMTGSPFDLGRDLQRASFSDHKGDLYLSGGFDSVSNDHPFGGGETEGSVGTVARWSSVGSELGSGPPAFEDGVVPYMMSQWDGDGEFLDFHSGREGHASVEFDGNLVVSGGFCFHFEGCGGDMANSCCHCNSRAIIRAAEYFAGEEWKEMTAMRYARAHFGLQPMCGKLVAFGGMDWRDDLLSSLEVVESVESQWARNPWLEMPEAKAYFSAISVTDLECM